MLDQIAETGRPAGNSQPHNPQHQESRRAQVKREIEKQVWADEVPSLIPDALSETLQPPGKRSPAYSEECERIRAKRETIAHILERHTIDELLVGVPYGHPARTFLNTLYPDARRHCQEYVTEERIRRMQKAGWL